MKWHLEDLPHILIHLPYAVQDLMQHENKQLVNAVQPTLALLPQPAVRHQIVSLNKPENGKTSSGISIEKSIDPIALRATENIGLLLHDYVHQLPGADLPGEEGKALLTHWRDIMLEHPERLANAHLSHWHEARSKQFLQDILEHRHGKALHPDELSAAWKDWQRASAAGYATGKGYDQQQKMQHQQWQDLVMRTRLHFLQYKVGMGYTPTGGIF